MRDDIEVYRVGGHYEIVVAGDFHCSCDNITEVVEELRALTEEEDAQ